MSTFSQNVPAGINGLALANVGFGVMVLKLSNLYRFRAKILWVVYLCTVVSIIMLLAYALRIATDFNSWWNIDRKRPQIVSTWGATAMAVCLIAVVADMEEIGFPFAVPFTVGIFGSVMQFVEMSWFIYLVIKERQYPEPYHNAATHSCLFPVLAVPGRLLVSIVFRRFFLSFGLLTVAPLVFTQVYRTLKPRDKLEDIVGNNPGVCIMQTAFSICLSAWFVEPMSGSATEGIGRIVTNTLFSCSTFVYICLWIAIWQRRKKLWNFGDDPSWSGATFPFANTAISAILYLTYMGNQFSPISVVFLQIWVALLAVIATGFILYVNVMYIRNGYFCCKVVVAKAPPVVDHMQLSDSNKPLQS